MTSRAPTRVLRTPDDRFDDLPVCPFDPHYTEIAVREELGTTFRVHYLDLAGARQFPLLVPVSPQEGAASVNRETRAVREKLETTFQKEQPRRLAGAIGDFIGGRP
ncbi:hypothetical protein FAF44_49860 [Nonomuraea sp. MG754425]|uniref:hypothetical protein n=1 Tax=Nonomuraea sp. MG754425 TaxID=2570319 RepID=UPI001F462408|nr:hypothetical protein [Nonomuraea sp. MG754425]MCF6476395.1 hypothetical protein [Nonomuraea sp. MG754425]